MERYKYTVLLFLLLTPTSLISSSLHAATDSFCTNYATLGVEQYRASIKAGCNFSGLRWNDDTEGQKQWCLTVDENSASKETLARAEALIECKITHTSDKELSYKEKEGLTQALINAATEDDIAKIEKLIIQGADINRELDGNFGTPLLAAIKAQAINAVKFFVEQGVDPQRSSNGGENLLNYVLYGDKDKIVSYTLLEYLLNNGLSANRPGESGDIPLFTAIENNDVKAVQILLQHGTDANLHVNAISPPLITAIQENKADIIKLLLESGANPNISEYDQKCEDIDDASLFTGFPLSLAKDNIDLVKLLTQFGAKGEQSCIGAKS